MSKRPFSLEFKLPSRTKSEFKNECDINMIVARAKKLGQLPLMAGRSQSFADVTSITDYRETLEKVQNAQENFMSLPAKVRQRFNNNVFQLLQFLQNPQNRKEAISLGLVNGSPTNSETTVSVPPNNTTGETDGK